jgi:hypothetical protein
MRETYDPGHKYNSAITCYMDTVIMGMSGYDDIVTHPSETVTEGVARIGKRLLFWDEQGFVSSMRYMTVAQASREFSSYEDTYNQIVVQWQRECMHKDHDEHGVCSECEAEVLGPLAMVPAMVYGYPGIAWRIDTHCEATNLVTCHMIGDDRSFQFEANEVTEINEDDAEYKFCRVCGQIGCGWGH